MYVFAHVAGRIVLVAHNRSCNLEELRQRERLFLPTANPEVGTARPALRAPGPWLFWLLSLLCSSDSGLDPVPRVPGCLRAPSVTTVATLEKGEQKAAGYGFLRSIFRRFPPQDFLPAILVRTVSQATASAKQAGS